MEGVFQCRQWFESYSLCGTLTYLLFTFSTPHYISGSLYGQPLSLPLAFIYSQAPHVLASCSSLFSQSFAIYYGTDPLTLALVVSTCAKVLRIQLMLFNSHSPLPPDKLNLRASQHYSFLSYCIQKYAMLIWIFSHSIWHLFKLWLCIRLITIYRGYGISVPAIQRDALSHWEECLQTSLLCWLFSVICSWAKYRFADNKNSLDRNI